MGLRSSNPRRALRGPLHDPPEGPLVRFPTAAAAGLALLLAACDGEKEATAPGKAGPPPVPKVDWNPEDLKSAPGELVAEPGTGTSYLTGVALDEQGKPVPGTVVEMHAAPRGEGHTGPVLHASVKANPDGTYRVGPGPTPWWSQGMLSAKAPGYARAALFSRAIANPGVNAALEGVENRLVLRRGYTVRGEIRAKDGGPPDGPVKLWATGGRGFFEIATSDAAGAFTIDAPEADILVRALAGVHPPTQEVIAVSATKENRIRLTVERGKDIRGTVVDQGSGSPVPGAVVMGYYGETRVVTAGRDATFLLPKYWFRTFQVRFPGYATRVHQLADDAGTAGVEPETVKLAPGFVARGRVVDTAGRPVGGSRLRVLTLDRAGERLASEGPTSRPDGSFVYVGLPIPLPGREIRVFAKGNGFAWGFSGVLPAAPGAVVDGVEVRETPLVLVEGRLEDQAGVPVGGVLDFTWEVPKELEPYRDVVPAIGRILAENGGRWQVQVPERTRYTLVARGDPFAEKKYEGVSPPSSGPGSGQPAPAIVIRVDRGISILGKVLDAQGAPVGFGEVRVEPHPPTDPRPSRDSTVRRDGTFEAGGLAPGLYDLSVLAHPAFLQKVVREVQAGGPTVEVTLRRPGRLRFHVVTPGDIPVGTPIEMSLRGLEDTRPLPQSHSVQLDPGEPRPVVGPLAPVAYAVTVRSGDYRADLDRVVVGEGEPTDIGDVVLKPAGSVSGRVLSGAEPLGDAAVEVLRLLPEGRSESVRRTRTAADGTFRAGGLLTGPHVLAVRARDRPFFQVRFEAVMGEDRPMDVAVPVGGRLRVTVLDAAGKPVAGARVVVTGTEGGVPYWKAGSPEPPPHGTGPDGTLRCTGLPVGDLRVDAEKPGTGSGTASVQVADGAEAAVEVRLGK